MNRFRMVWELARYHCWQSLSGDAPELPIALALMHASPRCCDSVLNPDSAIEQLRGLSCRRVCARRLSRGPEPDHSARPGGSEACGSAQRRGLVGAFPGELGLVASKVAVRGSLLINGAQQVEHLHDAFGPQVKVLAHQSS